VDWQDQLTELMLASRLDRGGWGYHARTTLSAEATALAAVALHAHNSDYPLIADDLRALTELQQPNGSVAPAAGLTEPGWPTALAIVAWCTNEQTRREFNSPIERAVAWLTNQHGEALPPRPDVYGHDTSIRAWPWVDGTHSWVEPTAYAVLALRAAGRGDHPRVRDGVRLLLDRALPDGGWNYGNIRVFDGVLRPFPATTGMALAALHGEPSDSRIEAGMAYLDRELPRIRAPISLAWGVIGLSAWNAAPIEARMWLAECADRLLYRMETAAGARLVSDKPRGFGNRGAADRETAAATIPARNSSALDIVGCALPLIADRPDALLAERTPTKR
jgi:hypothetical protein